ncbi:gamma-tocopherol methyltransferase [Labilithrix luteola]|uniref:Gamma-tocopherol methyltransferase n=1 Tax=Labilithrix luteola TaxID=1391654 RepID=A0A0K1PYI8_9BACT|nr:bifunctional 2-polyprenyl-6-hydroxyphenol methylase/3-demethylubiquinol 3-O-methyltransferase UbiG [Labilithrix luteola]AKU98567.1 gamma-tocopherol methyltransferase [Labilithrix luteola]
MDANATIPRRQVNNAIYEALGARWYEAQDDPVALLRAEARLRNPWVIERIAKRFANRHPRILDVGCGAGFLSNALAKKGFDVTGVDVSPQSLHVAAEHDLTASVRYRVADACALPYTDRSFDVVCAMDFLEHVEDPSKVIAEAARVLAPGGLFFFHTFNRTPLAWLVVLKGVEWFVDNVPPDLHLYRLFLKPKEVEAMCQKAGLDVTELTGSRPVIGSRAFLRLLLTGVVPKDFAFTFSSSTQVAYTGVATRTR